MDMSKDELLKRAKEDQERERKRIEEIRRSEKPVNYKSRMPLGCWLWIALAIVVIIWLLKKYGSGI
jgi:hypothetical protein